MLYLHPTHHTQISTPWGGITTSYFILFSFSSFKSKDERGDYSQKKKKKKKRWERRTFWTSRERAGNWRENAGDGERDGKLELRRDRRPATGGSLSPKFPIALCLSISLSLFLSAILTVAGRFGRSLSPPASPSLSLSLAGLFPIALSGSVGRGREDEDGGMNFLVKTKSQVVGGWAAWSLVLRGWVLMVADGWFSTGGGREREDGGAQERRWRWGKNLKNI